MGLRDRVAKAATDPMNSPMLSPGHRALAIAIGVQVEEATVRALRRHDAETIRPNALAPHEDR